MDQKKRRSKKQWNTTKTGNKAHLPVVQVTRPPTHPHSYYTKKKKNSIFVLIVCRTPPQSHAKKKKIQSFAITHEGEEEEIEKWGRRGGRRVGSGWRVMYWASSPPWLPWVFGVWNIEMEKRLECLGMGGGKNWWCWGQNGHSMVKLSFLFLWFF